LKSTDKIFGATAKLSLAALALSLSLFSCGTKQSQEPVEAIQIEKKNASHKWFALNKDGYAQVDAPQKAPAALKKPWTEALRVSCMGQSTEKSPLDISQGGTPRIYALTNRLGIIVMSQDAIKVFKDPQFFDERTADKLVFMNGSPIYSVYRNSYFNEKISSRQPFRPFLIQFTADSGVYFPILTYENLSLPQNSEVNDFCWDGSQWFCSIKNYTQTETNFSYLKFRPETALLSISPEKNLIAIQKSSEDEFRAIRRPKDFSAAPARVKNLLKGLPADFDFYAECKDAGGATARQFIHSKINDPNSIARAVVQISGTWIAALFEDGTLYLNGALYANKILNKSKNLALRLPKMPEGYKYTDFGISGATLFAAWEQTDFYETGRAGFLQVDLKPILYKDAE
jgi:hypothetical protein